MAPGVGRAAALAVVACLAVGIAWLPPEPAAPRHRSGSEIQRLRREAAVVARHLRTAHEALRFLERRDSLARLFADAEPAGVAGPDVPEPWRAWLAEQTARLPASAAGRPAPLLAALFVDTASSTPGGERQWRRWWWLNSTVIAFDSAAAPFSCLAIHDLRSRIGSWEHRVLASPDQWRSRNAFGICRFFAAYGAPGPGVRAWLSNGGWLFGATAGRSRGNAFDPSRFPRRDVFWSLMSEGLYALSGCVNGTASDCRDWLAAPDPDPRQYLRLGHLEAFVAGWWTESFGGWLSDLEAEMGRERVSRFWTSPLPFDSAFVAAFAIDAGRWTRDWLATRYGPLPHRGPRPADYATTILLAGLLTAYGAARAVGRNLR